MTENPKGFIPEHLYKDILNVIPIPCVDIVVKHDGKFLLGKRANKPNQGEWFIFGGRVLKNETLIDSAKRKLNEELGIDADVGTLSFLTTGETIHDDSNIEGVTSHTINSVFLLDCKEEPEIKLDMSQNSEAKWFSKIDESWQPYVKFSLEAGGFKQNGS